MRRARRDPELWAGVGRTAAEGAGLLVALPLWIWWATWKGGYPPAVFLPGIGYLAIASLALCLFAPRPRLTRCSAWALGALALLTVWTVFSLVWAEDRGAAEIASARQVLLFASFALPAVWSPTTRALTIGLAALPCVALLGAITALFATLADPATLEDGRLLAPAGYTNATAALLAMGVPVSLVLFSRRELPVAARAVALAVGGALLQAFLLTQSRGGLVALGIVLLLALLLTPGRLRLLLPIGVLALAAWVGLDPLLEVRRLAVEGGDVAGALDGAIRTMVLTSLALLALGTVYAGLDTRLEIGTKTVRRLSVAVIAVVGAAVIVAVVAVASTGPAPGEWISEKVTDFKTADYAELESQPTRFTGDLGSNRYDYWRVSVDVFADHPGTGTGAGNFIAPFLERRKADKSTIYSHSIWLETLAELGAVGFLALLAFAISLVLALIRAGGRPGVPRWLVATAALPLAYLLIHGAIDWISVFPAVAAPAMALAGGATGVGRFAGEPSVHRRVSPAIGVAAALVLATLLSAPLLMSARLADRAMASWRADPAAAVDDLERAAALDPLAAAPYVQLGVVGVELERPALARDAFRSALERDPSAWYPRFQLGLLAAAAGRRGAAVADVEAALERNPREPEVRQVLRKLRKGGRPDARAVQARV